MAQKNSPRLQINFQRLMQQCKKMSQDLKKTELWRFESYVGYLEKLFLQLQDSSISQDQLLQYGSDLNFLKRILEAEKKVSSDAKLLAAKQLPIPSGELSTTVRSECIENVSLRQVRAKATVEYTSDLRKELLGQDTNTGLRLRQTGDALETDSADIDAVLKHHHDVQTKLAEEFLQLTRGLKQTITIAGEVVKKDNVTLDRVQSAADKNYTHLGTQSERLEQYAYRSWWDCGLWMALLFVCLTFIALVLFMRLFPKR